MVVYITTNRTPSLLVVLHQSCGQFSSATISLLLKCGHCNGRHHANSSHNRGIGDQHIYKAYHCAYRCVHNQMWINVHYVHYETWINGCLTDVRMKFCCGMAKHQINKHGRYTYHESQSVMRF